MILEFKWDNVRLSVSKEGLVSYQVADQKTSFKAKDLREFTYYFNDGSRTSLKLEDLGDLGNIKDLEASLKQPVSQKLWLLILKGEDLLERNNNHTERRRHESYSDKNDKWATLAHTGDQILDHMIKEADRERLVSAIARLLPQQRDLLDKVYIKDIPIKEIASLEGVSSSAISHRLKKIHKRLEKLLKTFD